MKGLQIEEHNLVKASKKLRAVNHQLRSTMLKLMHSHGAINVQDIYNKLKIEQSVASQQLGILRDAGLVQTKREGRNILYSVNYSGLIKLDSMAKRLLELPKKNN